MRLSSARFLVIILAAILAACSSGSDGCKSDMDCDENLKCDNASGKCIARCSCLPEEECTATAPECAVKEVIADAEEVVQCATCAFQSDCDDDNSCTKDSCVDGCCSFRVFSVEEAVGCCITVSDCQDLMNPLATPEDPDADPCTVDYCLDFRCVNEVENSLCCHNDFECTDENDCTTDKCIGNECVFSDPIPNCCAKDTDCKDDNPCTLDICLAGACVYPQDSLNLQCTCESNFDCDDKNDCTLDSCVDARCGYDKASAGDCCGDSTQCDDEDSTTDDFCKMYTCIHRKHKTCIDDSTCQDGNACTEDRCLEGICIHEHTDDPYCCNYNTDCDDDNSCTAGACIDHACKYQILEAPGCCKTALECDDGIGCTIDECKDWGCAHSPVGAKCCTPDTAELVCDDGNPCTIDSCKNGLCDWQIVTTGCCEKNTDCTDCINTVTGASCQVDLTTIPPTCKGENCVINVCTNQSCSNEFCYYTTTPGCCLINDDCDDGNSCTDDICNPDHKCKNSLGNNCCASNGMCNDGKICTIDICDILPGEEKGSCKYDEKPDCCTGPDDCEPKTCKETHCTNGNCIYQPMDNCCVHAEDCDDNDICTIDQCVGNACQHIPSGLCE